MQIRPETGADHESVERVQELAFADARIPTLVSTLRTAAAPLPPVSLVASVDGQVVGHVMLSASRLDAPRRLVDVYVLSPLGVLPDFQRQGIGTRLVEQALAAARDVPLVFLEGSPAYYGKRGFTGAVALGFRAPSLRIPEPAFQVAPMPPYEPWMTGTLVYSAPFWDLDCVGLR
ncbi:GNAT family N-acetyltransferase [Amycolatopsis sp. GM8]|uniref:GNAT family N-acetyltransferase n=1 Tax=Amycolatopsis sp. GM8 TaxID=2896530 RepID=UPI001F3CB9F0|nr:N-acetyltransferase [Amycolatopsis sp. GM8]